MSSWSYKLGHFVPVTNLQHLRPVLQQQTTNNNTTTLSNSSGGLIYPVSTQDVVQVGEFVEIENTVSSTLPPIVRATHDSPVALGVVRNITGSGAQVANSGVAFAWVIQGQHDPPLSGFYAKSINGIHKANVVVDVQGSSFTISATKGKEIENLRARLDALTTST